MFRLILAFLLILSSTPAFAVTQWNKALPASGDNLTAWPAAVNSQWSIADTLLSNYRRGERVIYKSASTLTVTSGEVVVSNSGGSLRIFLQDASNTDITTANLDTGASFSSSTTYYVYAGTSTSTAASSTYYISLSSSSPSGVTYYAQIGSFITDVSGNIVSQYVYDSAYGNLKVDSAGKPMIQAAYDYGTSTSSPTLRTGGVLVVYGTTTSLTSGSSFAVTGLPFTSSSSYSCTTAPAEATGSNGGNMDCVQSSGSALTITNNETTTHAVHWMATGT